MVSTLTSTQGHFIVLEGPHRAKWERLASDEWRLRGIWPSREEGFLVRQHLEMGRGLLVVIDSHADHLLAISGELAELPEAAYERTGDDIVEVQIPLLDWLPSAYLDFALRFRDRVNTQFASVPIALRPPLAMSDAALGDFNVRFALRTAPATTCLSSQALSAVADFVFGPNPYATRRDGRVGAWRRLLSPFRSRTATQDGWALAPTGRELPAQDPFIARPEHAV